MEPILKIIRTVLALLRRLKILSIKKYRLKDYVYLTVEEVIQFNIKVTGIQGQLRDQAGLESAIIRPQMASYYDEADIAMQAALLVDGICTAHSFIDGNKRTALIACITFLTINQCKLKRTKGQIGKEIESLVVKGDINHFTEWLRQRIDIL